MSRTWKSGSTRRWRRIRASVLARDGHRCKLQLDGCTTVAGHVHHTMPREIVGDDPRYLLAACESCNLKAGDPRKTDPTPSVRAWWRDASPAAPSALTTRRTATPRRPAPTLPPTPGERVLVCGPPCAGKTTWAYEQQATTGGLVLDQDELGTSRYRAALAELPRHRGPAYIIRCLPGAERREEFARQIGATRTVLLLPPRRVLDERARQRSHPARHLAAIRDWFDREAGASPTATDTDTNPAPNVRPWW